MVRVYAADIRQLAPKRALLTKRLDAARQERIRARGEGVNALRCLATGLLLHEVLGPAYSDGQLSFEAHGKPYLSGGRPFNLSHAGDYAVLAVADRAVGVDVEAPHAVDPKRIAARFFHPDEQAYLSRADDPRDAFFTVWTLKESFLKAEGCGFSLSPASFCVLPEGADGARLLGKTAYRFRRYDALPGHWLSVCSADTSFCGGVRLLSF